MSLALTIFLVLAWCRAEYLSWRRYDRETDDIVNFLKHQTDEIIALRRQRDELTRQLAERTPPFGAL